MKKLECDVVIAGSGPVGMTLALQLAAEGINTVVLEKEAQILREPRAVGIDGESLRTWQALGLIEALSPFIHFPLGGRYLNARGEELFWLNYEGQEPCGFPLKQSFEQGETDYVLAGALERHPHAEHLFNHEIIDFSQDSTGVHVSVLDEQGEPLSVRSQYLVGCDGGRSTVRKIMGVEMKGESNEYPWLVIDTYDHTFKSGPMAMFFCDPKRPGMTLRISENQRRWEWMSLPGETPQQMLDDEFIRELISPFTDFDQVEIFRRRVYKFSAVIAERWQDGRVFLAGDAAHMTPPFAGQGLNAGIRDTRNLSWKLALVLKGHASADLLETYELERRDHTRELLDFALKLGEQIQPLDPELAEERDRKFAKLRKDPEALSRYLEELTRPQGIRTLTCGAIASKDQHFLVGRYVQQSKMLQPDGSKVLLDELLGPGFCVLGFDCDPQEELPPDIMSKLGKIGVRTAAIGRMGDRSIWPQDPSGTLDELFRNESGTLAVIRPDRFIVCAFTSGEHQHGMAGLADGLSLLN